MNEITYDTKRQAQRIVVLLLRSSLQSYISTVEVLLDNIEIYQNEKKLLDKRMHYNDMIIFCDSIFFFAPLGMTNACNIKIGSKQTLAIFIEPIVLPEAVKVFSIFRGLISRKSVGAHSIAPAKGEPFTVIFREFQRFSSNQLSDRVTFDR